MRVPSGKRGGIDRRPARQARPPVAALWMIGGFWRGTGDGRILTGQKTLAGAVASRHAGGA